MVIMDDCWRGVLFMTGWFSLHGPRDVGDAAQDFWHSLYFFLRSLPAHPLADSSFRFYPFFALPLLSIPLSLSVSLPLSRSCKLQIRNIPPHMQWEVSCVSHTHTHTRWPFSFQLGIPSMGHQLTPAAKIKRSKYKG